MTILPLYCSKERRTTDHSLINEDHDGRRHIKITCLSCLRPEIRTDIVIADRTSVRNDIWTAYEAIGPSTYVYDQITPPQKDPKEEKRLRRQQRSRRIKEKLAGLSISIKRQWRPILIIGIVTAILATLYFR